ncbi:Starch synthase 3, chloroplastic/amyloplastic [Vitis vinifera]|uniref:starch synthase n=1 Tax=Vitis vinifera TaxID=29760 RepID=A0A438JGQ9_VITVI|nr:Starch synthase 3, chloroplastic/amyloplastic [Vitis vinifera]
MEVALQAQRPVSCRALSDREANFKIKPFLGFFPNGRATQSSQHSWRREFPLSGVSNGIVASADFSRRRQRKVSMSGPRGPGPKGFLPKTPVETSTQKRDQRNTGKNEDPSTPTSSEYVGTGKKTLGTDEEQTVEITRGTEVDEERNDKGSSAPTSSEYESGKKTLEMTVVAVGDGGKFGINRSVSTLSNEPDVMIMGAFNDWRWKSFTIQLNKTHLQGDWWSCQVHIPKEAYKMDFVFFNGTNVYDNNNQKDFCIPVHGGMDALAFEDILLEEKRRELEKLAKEQAERERQAEEQRRIEAEKAAREADRAQARAETERRREMLQHLMKKGCSFVDNVWCIEPRDLKVMTWSDYTITEAQVLLLMLMIFGFHGGHNNWKDGLSIVGSLIKDEKKEGDWWYVEVVVPERALVLDWVFADGPPQRASLYDNNHREDFHAIVPQSISEELYWVEEEYQIYKKLQEERWLREEAIRAKEKSILGHSISDMGTPENVVSFVNFLCYNIKAPEVERTARMKAEAKERTLKMFLLSQKHIVYTEPLDVQAGSTVSVLYNPANTVLNGKSEVWFRCSFNRWTHRNGSLPPQKMLPVDNGSHLKATGHHSFRPNLSGHLSIRSSLSLWPSLIPIISPCSQSQGRKCFLVGRIVRKTFTVGSFSGELSGELFRATVFFSTPQGAPGGDLQFFPKPPEPENHPRAVHARFFRPAREPLSGDALPPPGSPDADQPPFLPVSAI